MKRITKVMRVLLLITVIYIAYMGSCAHANADSDTKIKPIIHVEQIDDSHRPLGNTLVCEPVPVEPVFKKIDAIPLDSKLQQYIWNKCNDNGIDFITIMAVIKTESRFNINESSPKRRDGSCDQGLVQINSKYIKENRKMMGASFNPFDPYDAVDYLIVRYMNEEKYWANKGKSGIRLVKCVLGSYNSGRTGYTRRLKRSGYDYWYTNAVLKNIDEMSKSFGNLLPSV